MSAPFMGEVRVFAGTFAPRDWTLCNGQTLAISQNDALFALIGTTYGGDGVTTFAVPDARGRVPVGQGNGSGLSPRVLGQQFGHETITLTTNQLPAHTHLAIVSDTTADQTNPAGQLIGKSLHYLAANQTPLSVGQLLPNAMSNIGGNQPHENMMPFLCTNFILCLQGIFPSRN